jgi:prolyl oligopeptidase
MTAYPHAPAEPLVETLHGREIADPFRWLEDPDTPATVAWVAAQRRLTDAYFAALPEYGALERWCARVRELAARERVSLPLARAGRVFFTRTGADDEVPRLYLRDVDGAERVVLDLGPGRALDGWRPSPDGRLLACQTSPRGSEHSVLRVLDVDTGAVVDGPVDRVRYSTIAWLPDSSGFYYVRSAVNPDAPGDDRPYRRRVLLRRIGADTTVFGGGFPAETGFRVAVHADRWLVVQARASVGAGNRTWLADLCEQPADSPVFRAIGDGPDVSGDVQVTEDGTVYLATTHQAPRGRLCVTHVREPGSRRELVPEDPRAVLEAFAVTDAELLVVHARRGVHELTARDRATGRLLRRVRLPGAGRITGMSERSGRAGLWLAYTDHHTPEEVRRYRSGDDAVLPANAAGPALVPAVPSRHVTYRSPDGTAVRMLVIGVRRSGPQPTLITGYGGFGVSMLPQYDPSVLAWVEAGGLVAIPAIRGGGEEGVGWHHAGSREGKQRSFDDFTAAAQWLIDRGWTAADRLGAFGASNAGLLVGAALTQHPELYRAAVCTAPLLDMVRYELFGLGPSWRQEYGSAAVQAELNWLLSYSPYHRVRPRADYPAVMLQVHDNDTRVDPLHARKMAARLQHANPSGRPVLFRNLSDMGHGTHSRAQAALSAAAMLAFLAHETGLHLT